MITFTAGGHTAAFPAIACPTAPADRRPSRGRHRGKGDGRELTEEQHREAAAKLSRLWERIGFETFQDGYLDCHLQRPQDLLAERQEEFNALCRAWREHHQP
ncbi:hypothetical protein ACIRP7_19550 [Streptomyces sp. NPDC102270]|uniref:hypothetical protein n=1 Tax=Streptomyces sp. NPDC102270 TaxID=3366150 RepID=UPI00380F8EEA